jgi:hypothetical protein
VIKGCPVAGEVCHHAGGRGSAGGFAPGRLGELSQIADFALVDAVLAKTGAAQRRIRLLPARVVMYFVLAPALFED